MQQPDGRRLRALLLAALLPAAALAGPELCHVSFSSGATLLMPVARSWQDQQEGLSGRLDAGPGLLFVWEETRVRALWMKNTYIPLSAAFLDENGRVLDIVDMEPASEDRHSSPGPVGSAIELARGDFERHHIEVGDTATFRCDDATP